MKPNVLVVMPTLGRRLDTMQQAVRSVLSQGVSVHLVVVAPQDACEARDIAREAGASIVDDPGTGLSGAVNAGLAADDGEAHFLWLNDDDSLLPGGMRRLLQLAENKPSAVVAFGGCRYVSQSGRRIGTSRAGWLAYRTLRWGPDLIPQPAALMRLADVVQAGGYDTALRCAMDLDMLLRLRGRGQFVWTRDEVATFRWHSDSISVSSRRLAVAEARRVKRRQLPRQVRWASSLWDRPVALATWLAGRQVSYLAERRERQR